MRAVCFMLAFILVAASPVATTTASAQGSPRAAAAPADSAAALAATIGFLAAFDSLQWDRFRGYLADDMTMFFPFPQVPSRADGKAAVEAVFSRFFEANREARTRDGRPMVQGLQPRDLRVQMAGADVAVASFHLGPANAPARRSLVLHRDVAGEWKVLHWHASAVTPPPEPAAAAPEVPLSAEERARYIGTYDLAPTVPLQLRVFERDGALYGQATGQEALALRHQGDHTFVAVNGARLVFTMGEGRATGLTLHQGGRSVPGTRID